MGRWLPVVVVAAELDVAAHRGRRRGHCPSPDGEPQNCPRYRIIVDPIDGTRGLMYSKRSAWITPASHHNTMMFHCFRTSWWRCRLEIPPPKQTLADTLIAVRGSGAWATRTDLETGATTALDPVPPAQQRASLTASGHCMRGFRAAGTSSVRSTTTTPVRELLGRGREGKAATMDTVWNRWPAGGARLRARPLGGGPPPPARASCWPNVACPARCAAPLRHLHRALIAEELEVESPGPTGRRCRLRSTWTPTWRPWVGFANTALRDAVLPVLQR